jgi:hypothetical protein
VGFGLELREFFCLFLFRFVFVSVSVSDFFFVSIATVFLYFASHPKPEEAMKWYDELKKRCLVPTVITFGTLIDMLGKQGKVSWEVRLRSDRC